MNLQTEFARCEPWLAAALDRAGSTHTLDDVRGMVASGDAVFVSGERCAVILETVRYPRCKALRYWLAGGDLAELQTIEARVSDAAKEHGYDRLEIIGRPGWEKALPGYRKLAVVLAKDL